MYIDILLAAAFVVSCYLLWRRISEKMPELAAMPDQEVSVMLQENTAKIQVFALHLFHFRSFYRERHYQDKCWNFLAKMFFKIHIFVLRLDNGLIGLVKKIRLKTEPRQNANPVDFFKELQEKEEVQSVVQPKGQRMNEIRIKRKGDVSPR